MQVQGWLVDILSSLLWKSSLSPSWQSVLDTNADELWCLFVRLCGSIDLKDQHRVLLSEVMLQLLIFVGLECIDFR